VSTDTEGNFDLRLWTGEFTLAATTFGTWWEEPVTQKIVVEQGKPLEVELTLPTPLRINVVMPDGEPAGNFRLTHLAAYRPLWAQAGRPISEVSIITIYEARRFGDRRPFVVPERPIVVRLCNEENFVAVMTECNGYGIVRKIESELRGQELTLMLRPTIAGTVKLVDPSQNPVANQDISIAMRIMKVERNGDFAQWDSAFASNLWFRTDTDGRLDFKVPLFEGIDDTIWLFFRKGNWSGSGGSGSTRRSGNFLGVLVNWLSGDLRRANERFRHFRPPADGERFDLGVMEMER